MADLHLLFKLHEIWLAAVLENSSSSSLIKTDKPLLNIRKIEMSS